MTKKIKRTVVTTKNGRAFFQPVGTNTMVDARAFDGFDDFQCEDFYDEFGFHGSAGHISCEDGVDFDSLKGSVDMTQIW